jgi:DNA-binding MarR family transcriptional regulator
MQAPGKARRRSATSRALEQKAPAVKASSVRTPPPSAPQALSLASLEGHLGYFVRRLQVEVFTDFIRTLAPLKVRPAQYSVLMLVEANPGRSQAAIGKALNIERARLARLLHELERRKWIERRSATGDGRSHSLFLTRAGQTALVKIKRLAQRHENHLTTLVGANRRAALMKLLRDFG